MVSGFNIHQYGGFSDLVSSMEVEYSDLHLSMLISIDMPSESSNDKPWYLLVHCY